MCLTVNNNTLTNSTHWLAGNLGQYLKDTVTDYKSEGNKRWKHLWLPPMATDSVSLNGHAKRKFDVIRITRGPVLFAAVLILNFYIRII